MSENPFKPGRKVLRTILEGTKFMRYQTVQRKPFTMVTVRARYSNYYLTGVGFSKVMWPDKWDPENGVRVAKERAKLDAARQVYALLTETKGDMRIKGAEDTFAAAIDAAMGK